MGADLRRAIADRPLIGTFVKIPRAEVADVLALAGFDFAICDMEHGQVTEAEAREVILAAGTSGLPVVVRVAELARGPVNRLLEAGAAGIQMPRLADPAGAATLARLTRYPPEGSRSVSQAQRAARYGAEPLADYLARSNREVLLVGQLETREVEGPLDDVVRGVDVAFVGSLDLTVDFGVPGRLDEPDVAARVAGIEAAAGRTGTALGIFAPTASAARAALASGYRYVAVGADVSFLSSRARDLVAELREATKARPEPAT